MTYCVILGERHIVIGMRLNVWKWTSFHKSSFVAWLANVLRNQSLLPAYCTSAVKPICPTYCNRLTIDLNTTTLWCGFGLLVLGVLPSGHLYLSRVEISIGSGSREGTVFFGQKIQRYLHPKIPPRSHLFVFLELSSRQ